MGNFKFNIGDSVRIKVSGEKGEVLGRAEYATAENSYFLRYRSGLACAVEQWWQEGALDKPFDVAGTAA